MKFLEGIFCGVTNTSVLDVWWRLLWVSKSEWAAVLVLGKGICVTYSLVIHLWCDTCWLLGSQALLSQMGIETRIYGAAAASHYETRQTLYRLSYDGWVEFVWDVYGLK